MNYPLHLKGIRKAAASVAILGFVSLSGYGQLPEGDLANGLIGYYSLDGNANDTSGNGNDGIGTALTYSTNRFGDSGASGNFKGLTTNSQSYVTISSFNTLGNYPVTFSAWFTLNSLVSGTNGSIMTLIGKEAAGARGEGAVALTTGGLSGPYTNKIGYIGFSTNYVPPNENFVTSFTPNTNQWYNLIFTYDAIQTASFYLDGVLIAQQVYENTSFTNMPFRIGSSSSAVQDENATRPSWDGLIDDVAVYNRALSSTEVTELYNFQAVPEPSTYALIAVGGAALWAFAARKRTRRSDE